MVRLPRVFLMLLLVLLAMGCTPSQQPTLPPLPTVFVPPVFLTQTAAPPAPPTATATSVLPPTATLPFVPVAETLTATPDPNRSERLLTVLEGHANWISTVRFSPDGRYLASAGADGALIMWNAQDFTIRGRMHGHQGTILCLAFSPDSKRLVSGGMDKTARVWDSLTGGALMVLERIKTRHIGPIWGAAFSADGQALATVSQNGWVFFYNGEDGTESGEVDVRVIGDVRSLAFFPTNRLVLAIAGSKTTRVYMPEGDNIIANYPVDASEVIFDPKGDNIITAGHGIHLWSTFYKRRVADLAGHNAWVWSVAVDPSGSIMASGSKDRNIIIWDYPGRYEKYRIQTESSVNSVSISPDKRYLAAAVGNKIHIYWLGEGRPLMPAELQPILPSTTPPAPAAAPQAQAQATLTPTLPNAPAQWNKLAPDANVWAIQDQGGWQSLVYKANPACRVDTNRNTGFDQAPQIKSETLDIGGRSWEHTTFGDANGVFYDTYVPTFMGTDAPVYGVSAADVCRIDLVNMLSTIRP